MNIVSKKEVGRYLVSGVMAFGTDSVVYYILLHFIPLSIAKAISFICGTCVAYFMNKYWTWEQKEKSISEAAKFAAVYGSSLVVNVGVNRFFLWVFPGYLLFAFLAATGASVVWNFIGQRWWVFKRAQ